MLKNLLIIQARMGSKRFPGKIFKKIKNFKSIELQIKRLKKSKKISKLVVATSNSKKDLKLTEFLKKNKILFYRSDEKNVLKKVF
jgi:spore coat polysaccharide biosynthesis protein SpsF (cytidylyltransferase family)